MTIHKVSGGLYFYDDRDSTIFDIFIYVTRDVEGWDYDSVKFYILPVVIFDYRHCLRIYISIERFNDLSWRSRVRTRIPLYLL